VFGKLKTGGTLFVVLRCLRDLRDDVEAKEETVQLTSEYVWPGRINHDRFVLVIFFLSPFPRHLREYLQAHDLSGSGPYGYRYPGFRPRAARASRADVCAFVLRGEKVLTPYSEKKKRFFTVGYEDGYAHGRLHGLIEGRALGAEKGFELWEELGFYEGAARLWTAIFSTDSSGTDACVLLSIPCPPKRLTRPRR
jgi:hypothetical protein